MEAELRHAAAPRPVVQPSSHQTWRDVLFSISQARRALPYVAAVAAEAVEAFEQVRIAREALAHAVDPRRRNQLSEQRDRGLRRLDLAIDDVNAVGANLVDLRDGMISLTGSLHGRHASLLWRVGDPIEGAWTDLESP